MTDDTLARLARLSAAADGGWVCRGRLEHLDWRPLLEARLAEQAPALGHVRLTSLGWARAYATAARTHAQSTQGDPPFGAPSCRMLG